MTRAPRIALVAGEASGDLLGAALIQAIRDRQPGAEFVGIGGPAMVSSGLNAWHPAERLAVMGLVEVLRHLPGLLRLRRDLLQRLLADPPDLYIGIDAPDFNLGVERRLRQAGVPTLHYVSPSVWAWREQRARKIGDSADRVLCLFPFEPEIYARHGVDARFVGHPLADQFATLPGRDEQRRRLGLDPDREYLAVLPGSRLGEVGRLTEVFLRAGQRLIQSRPGLELLLPAATPACRARIEEIRAGLGTKIPLRLFDGQAQEILIAADVALVASGTAALEALLAGRPMVVGYRIAPLSYALVRLFRMLKLPWVSLPNVLAGRFLVPERMQGECRPETLAEALEAQFEPAHQRALAAEFQTLAAQLRAPQGSAMAAAEASLELCR